MSVSKNYCDIFVSRNTVIGAEQIYDTFKKDGYVIIHGVYDCYELKRSIW